LRVSVPLLFHRRMMLANGCRGESDD
jgi:hypothetical protein